MRKFRSCIQTILTSAYDFFNRDKETTILDSRILKIIERDREEIYSPEVVNYLINKHMGELEYSLIEGKYSSHLVKVGNNEYYSLSKMKLLAAIESAYKDGAMSSLTYLKTAKLRKSATFEAFLSEHRDETYKFIRDVQLTQVQVMNEQLGYTLPHNIRKEDAVEIPVSTLIDFLLLPYEELEQVLQQKPFGLTKEEFAYTVLSYFKYSNSSRYRNETAKKNMLAHYYFPEQILSNIERLESSIDITLTEEQIQERPTYLDEIKISDELWQQVTSKIPSDFNDLEKAYYIYYQLCKTFTYDFSYFKWGETKKPSHIGFNRRIENIESKNSTYNNVVCYEIMAIYEKFIQHLNIPFDIDDGNKRGETADYQAHPTIRMAISDKYFIEADPTHSVIKGDMPLAKENRPVNGFKCKNNSEQVRQDFQASIDKVNAYIWQEEKNETSFFDVVDAYRKITDNPVELSSAEKMSIIMNSITQTELSPTDTLTYISELTKMLFPDGTCTNYYILDHQQEMADDVWKTTGIPALQIVLAYQAPQAEEPVYYLYSKETGLDRKTHDEVQEFFNQERYEYLTRYKKEIPNITIPKKEGGPYAY